jgi:hypothetical protein
MSKRQKPRNAGSAANESHEGIKRPFLYDSDDERCVEIKETYADE